MAFLFVLGMSEAILFGLLYGFGRRREARWGEGRTRKLRISVFEGRIEGLYLVAPGRLSSDYVPIDFM